MKFRYLILLLIIITLFYCNNKVVKSNSYIKIFSIAILDVQPLDKESKNYVKLATHHIEEEFSHYPEYIVVDRNDIEKVIKEISLSQSGLTDDQSVKIGRFIGAKRLVTSKLTKLNNTWVLSGKLIDVESSKIIQVSTGRVSEISKLDGASKGLSRRLTNRMD